MVVFWVVALFLWYFLLGALSYDSGLGDDAQEVMAQSFVYHLPVLLFVFLPSFVVAIFSPIVAIVVAIVVSLMLTSGFQIQTLIINLIPVLAMIYTVNKIKKRRKEEELDKAADKYFKT